MVKSLIKSVQPGMTKNCHFLLLLRKKWYDATYKQIDTIVSAQNHGKATYLGNSILETCFSFIQPYDLKSSKEKDNTNLKINPIKNKNLISQNH